MSSVKIRPVWVGRFFFFFPLLTCSLQRSLCDFYPVVGTDASKVGSRAAAEVERRHREAASLQTHHVGAAGSAVLHVAQVRAVLQQSVAPPDWKRPNTSDGQKVEATRLNILEPPHSSTCSPGTCFGGTA